MCGDGNTSFMSNGGKAHNCVVASRNSNLSREGKGSEQVFALSVVGNA